MLNCFLSLMYGRNINRRITHPPKIIVNAETTVAIGRDAETLERNLKTPDRNNPQSTQKLNIADER